MTFIQLNPERKYVRGSKAIFYQHNDAKPAAEERIESFTLQLIHVLELPHQSTDLPSIDNLWQVVKPMLFCKEECDKYWLYE